jgi:hypothetical protein
MCFSANASFGSGLVLSAIGVASLAKVKHPSQIMFASIPLVFAVQQFSEGFLWLTLPYSDQAYLQQVITHIFLIFAQVLWPLWVPIAIILVEKEKTRKPFQKVLVGIGILVALYFGLCLFFYHVQAKIVGYHIYYEQDYPVVPRNFGGALYIVATIAPLFFSHVKKMWILGLTILASYIVTAIFYDHYVVSVWCFFSSIISASVYLIMLEFKKLNKEEMSHKTLVLTMHHQSGKI